MKKGKGNEQGLAERTVETIWRELACYPADEYLPSAATLSKTIHRSTGLIGAAYKELCDRGYLVKRGNYFVKAMQGAFVAKEKA